MYNRYIPQPDGSYRRSRMPEQTPQPSRRPTPPPPEPECAEQEPCATEGKPPCQEVPHKRPTCPRSRQRPQRPSPPKQEHKEPPKGIPITSFLKQLLPGDFDTSDLLIVLLLLLMAGDCQEDQNSALLTLVLYLFL